MPSDYHSSLVQSWYASVQREFGPRMLVDVAYVGNRADDLLAGWAASTTGYGDTVTTVPQGRDGWVN